MKKEMTGYRQGFSLIESAIVLAVVGLVIASIWVAAAKVNSELKLNRMIEQVTVFADNALKIYTAQTLGTAAWAMLNMNTVRNLAILPPDITTFVNCTASLECMSTGTPIGVNAAGYGFQFAIVGSPVPNIVIYITGTHAGTRVGVTQGDCRKIISRLSAMMKNSPTAYALRGGSKGSGTSIFAEDFPLTLAEAPCSSANNVVGVSFKPVTIN